jgi:Mg/Co/Ni transporter MgtE
MLKSVETLLLSIVIIFALVPEVTYQGYTLASSSNSTNNTSTKTSANLSKAEPSDLADLGGSLLVTDIAAQELSLATPSEIATYPLNDFSTDDIVLILGALSTTDLEKVLTNIPLNVLQRIFSEAPEDKITEFLNDIPQNNSQKITQRLQS